MEWKDDKPTGNWIGFPSPYGVSFILILEYEKDYTFLDYMFPSPYGVSFILIKNFNWEFIRDKYYLCFRLLTEYHSFLYYFLVRIH